MEGALALGVVGGYVFVFVYFYSCTFICVFLFVYLYLCICICVFVSVYLYLCICVFVNSCICVFMYLYLCICICVFCICICVFVLVYLPGHCPLPIRYPLPPSLRTFSPIFYPLSSASPPKDQLRSDILRIYKICPH